MEKLGTSGFCHIQLMQEELERVKLTLEVLMITVRLYVPKYTQAVQHQKLKTSQQTSMVKCWMNMRKQKPWRKLKLRLKRKKKRKKVNKLKRPKTMILMLLRKKQKSPSRSMLMSKGKLMLILMKCQMRMYFQKTHERMISKVRK